MVKLSVKSDYAARAVLGLAQHYKEDRAVRAETLALEQGIPPKYLVQILIELKSQQIVKSIRGKSGGYMLARPPSDITLADVLRCVDGEVFSSSALEDPKCAVILQKAWKRLKETVENGAASIDFQDLVDQSAEEAKMYYI